MGGGEQFEIVALPVRVAGVEFGFFLAALFLDREHGGRLDAAMGAANVGQFLGQVIAERVGQEARALLKHTNWNIGEIASMLRRFAKDFRYQNLSYLGS